MVNEARKKAEECIALRDEIQNAATPGEFYAVIDMVEYKVKNESTNMAFKDASSYAICLSDILMGDVERYLDGENKNGIKDILKNLDKVDEELGTGKYLDGNVNLVRSVIGKVRNYAEKIISE